MLFRSGSILHPSQFPTDPKKEIDFSLFLAVPGRDRTNMKLHLKMRKSKNQNAGMLFDAFLNAGFECRCP